MGEPVFIPLNTRAPLDTAHPETDRAPGTLQDATEVHHRYWGPRVGRLAATRVWDGSGGAMAPTELAFGGTADDYCRGSSFADKFRDLPNSWTLDIYAQADSVSATTHLFSWFLGTSGIEAIRITAAATTGIFTITVKTTSSRGVLGTTTTLTTSSGPPIGANVNQNRFHLRVARDGGNTLYAWINGVAVGTSSMAADTDPHEDTLGGYGYYRLSDSAVTGQKWIGRIAALTLRDGAYTTLPIEMLPPAYCGNSDLHLYLVNTDFELEGGIFQGMKDLGPYHVNGRGPVSVLGTPVPNEAPFFAPVQGMGTWTSRNGKVLTAVMVGGKLYRKYA
jgi:hypothetical protein